MTRPHTLAPAAALAIVFVLGACSSEPAAPPAPADTSLEAPAVMLRLGATPEVFELDTNDAAGLAFTAPSLAGPSMVTVTLGDVVDGGINIFEQVEEQLASFTELPEGASYGQTQLVAPIGLTFMLRGRYQDEGRAVEELRAILVHPAGNRLLTASYRYPVGDDTSERGQQLMELLGEMEPLETASEPESTP
jgi:hypothetical protein